DKMFPANQLVVSPQEEQQKINFLKEQRIEGMLSQMEGVINAKISCCHNQLTGLQMPFMTFEIRFVWLSGSIQEKVFPQGAKIN
ncbi:hypothetical protein MJI46_34315, partial [Salmonella enterica subsp. enterica serovar Cerro]|nr:hypothetical protein [Salmonella enterica subsp. enterica serovar Cerro]